MLIGQQGLILFFFVAISITSFAQGAQEPTPANNNLPTSDNLADMQLEVLKPMMQAADEDDGIDWENTDNYLELLEQLELTEEEKAELRTMYFMQRTDLTQAEKDSIGRIISERIQNATPELVD